MIDWSDDEPRLLPLSADQRLRRMVSMSPKEFEAYQEEMAFCQRWTEALASLPTDQQKQVHNIDSPIGKISLLQRLSGKQVI